MSVLSGWMDGGPELVWAGCVELGGLFRGKDLSGDERCRQSCLGIE